MAPAVIAPGKVQPGTGTGRSIAPVATSTERASTRNERPDWLTQTSCASSPGTTCHTIARARYSAPQLRKRAASSSPWA